MLVVPWRIHIWSCSTLVTPGRKWRPTFPFASFVPFSFSQWRSWNWEVPVSVMKLIWGETETYVVTVCGRQAIPRALRLGVPLGTTVEDWLPILEVRVRSRPEGNKRKLQNQFCLCLRIGSWSSLRHCSRTCQTTSWESTGEGKGREAPSESTEVLNDFI